MTDRYAVIGNPIGHSKSPRIHAAFAVQTGQDLHYDALLAPLDDFAGTWQQFLRDGGRGANVTVPFKEVAWSLCQQLSERARRAGAVNTLMPLSDGRVFGDNTDGAGLVADIVVNAGWTLNGARVLLLGAGGAARGVIQPLLDAGVTEIRVVNRTPERAEALADLFADTARVTGMGQADWLAGPAHAPADVVINATSASLSGAALTLPAGSWSAQTAVYDMMYGRDTPFLAWARDAGLCHRRDGLGMLVEQAAEAFLLWRGVRPDTAPVLAQLRAELSA